MSSYFRVIHLCLLLYLFTQTILLRAQAQNTQSLTGIVMDKLGAGLPGATVLLKGSSNGTSTDEQGRFTLNNVRGGPLTLVVSFVGYISKDVSVETSQPGKALSINLDSDARQMDEVVVTGVFDKRERMDASITISTLLAAQIQLQVPNSTADLLKNVPEVYVNSSAGEIKSAVYSRRVSANSTTRNGNQQPFYRADVNLGGKLNQKGDLTFNVGGFYRYSSRWLSCIAG